MRQPTASRFAIAAKLAALIAATLASLAALLVLYLGFQENSQNEFYDGVTGQVDWSYALSFGASAFATVFLIVWPISTGVLMLTQAKR